MANNVGVPTTYDMAARLLRDFERRARADGRLELADRIETFLCWDMLNAGMSQ